MKAIIKATGLHWRYRSIGYTMLSLFMMIFEWLLCWQLFGFSEMRLIISGVETALLDVDLARLAIYILVMILVGTFILGWIYEYAITYNNFFQSGLLSLKKYFGYLLIFISIGLSIELGFMLFYLPGIIMAVWLLMLPYYYARYNKITFKRSFNFGQKHFWRLLIFIIVILVASLLISEIKYLANIIDLLLFGFLASCTAVLDEKWSVLSKNRSGITLNNREIK